MFHGKFQMFVAFSCLKPGNSFFRLIYIGSAVDFAVERSGICMGPDFRGREAAESAVRPVHEEDFSRDGYDYERSGDSLLTFSIGDFPIADPLKHPDMKQYFLLDELEFVLKSGIGKVRFQRGEYILDFPEGIDPLSGIVGQKGDEALEKLFFFHGGYTEKV